MASMRAIFIDSFEKSVRLADDPVRHLVVQKSIQIQKLPDKALDGSSFRHVDDTTFNNPVLCASSVKARSPHHFVNRVSPQIPGRV